jgi:thymidylate kinase
MKGLAKDSTRGRLVVFEGIDGSGKTTTAQRLAQDLVGDGHLCVFLPKRHIPENDPYVADHMKALADVIWDRAKSAPNHLLGYEHWIHLMAAYFAAFDHTCVQPLLDTGTTVIVDNWIYKFIMRISLASDIPLETVLAAFDGVAVPDRVYFLDVPAETAAARKTEFTWSETGDTSTVRPSPSDEIASFVRYQTGVRDRYLELGARQGWVVVDVADADVAEITARLVKDWS